MVLEVLELLGRRPSLELAALSRQLEARQGEGLQVEHATNSSWAKPWPLGRGPWPGGGGLRAGATFNPAGHMARMT